MNQFSMLKKEKKKGKVEVNPKYVALLQKSYQNFSKIDIIESSACRKKEDEKSELDNESNLISYSSEEKLFDIHESENGVDKVELLRKSTKVNHLTSSCRLKRKEYHTKITKNGRKIFSDEEDQFLLNFLSNNPDFEKNRTLKLRELEGLLNRSVRSIDCRIRNLQKGKKTNRKHKTFSLTEDKVIIDKAIKHLYKCHVLRETVIEKPRKLARKLNRNYLAVEQRWSVRIRSWLLQYYNKNLNLEIRPMLAEFLSKHFDSVHSIDWKFVSSQTEFSGHTEESLRNQFHSRILHYTARHLQKPNHELTLKEIAHFTNKVISEKHNKISSSLERRQMECIDYFAKKIKNDKTNCQLN